MKKYRPMIDRFTLVVKIAGKVLPLLRQGCTPHDVYEAVLMAISECPSVMISQEELSEMTKADPSRVRTREELEG